MVHAEASVALCSVTFENEESDMQVWFPGLGVLVQMVLNLGNTSASFQHNRKLTVLHIKSKHPEGL